VFSFFVGVLPCQRDLSSLLALRVKREQGREKAQGVREKEKRGFDIG